MTLRETAEEVRRELAVADVLRERCKAEDLIAYPQGFWLDYALMREGVPNAFIEIKCRNVKRQKHRDLWIAKSKIDRAILFRDVEARIWKREVPIILVIQWVDGIYFHEVDMVKHRYSVKEDVTAGRQSAVKTEHMYEIPVRLFKPIDPNALLL